MKGRAFWLVAILIAVAIVLLLVPQSPLSVLRWLMPPVQSAQSVSGRSVPDLIADLSNATAAVRSKAAFELGTVGPEAHPAAAQLGTLVSDDADGAVRHECALALMKIGPKGHAAVPGLAKALDEDKEPVVRANAAQALFVIGGPAAGTPSPLKPIIPILFRAIDRADNKDNAKTFHQTIQEIAARTLGRATAGTDEAVPALLKLLAEAPTGEARAIIVQALGDVGPAAAPKAGDTIRKLATDKNNDLREAAEQALERLGLAKEPDKKQGQAPPADELHLAEAERTYLWEIEHHGNVLVKHGFGPLAAALVRADAAALTPLLADDFRGTDLAEPRRVALVDAAVTVERLMDDGKTSPGLPRDAFTARLLAYRSAFSGKAPQVKLALMTLSPATRRVLDGPWEATAQLRLHGETTPGAPAETVVLLRLTLARPTEEILNKPGWLRGAAVVQSLTGRAPRPLFADVTAQRGLDPAPLHDNWTASPFAPVPGGAFVCDFDRDGYLDLLVTDVNRTTLYRGGPGGRFTDVTASCGLPTGSAVPGFAAWVDLDGDGWDDLILAGQLYRNEEGRRFVDVTTRSNLRLPPDLNGIAIADYDHDGRLDLYATRTGRPGDNSWLDGKSGSGRGNTLYRNKGNWQFEDVTRTAGVDGDRRSTFASAWLDADDDGWPDLFVPNEFGDGVLLLNQRNGTFRGQALADRPADFGTMGLAVGDVDNDGRVDIYCANMYSKAGTRVIGNLAADAYAPPVLEKMRRFVAGSQLHLNKGGGKYEQVGRERQVAAVGWAYGAALADLNNDGFLDIYATAGYVSRDRAEADG